MCINMECTADVFGSESIGRTGDGAAGIARATVAAGVAIADGARQGATQARRAPRGAQGARQRPAPGGARRSPAGAQQARCAAL